VERPAADEEMRDAARFQGLDVWPRDVLVEVREAPEEKTHVTRRDGQPLVRALALRHRPPALADEPRDEGGHGVRL
jgi:hypothetical protein